MPRAGASSNATGCCTPIPKYAAQVALYQAYLDFTNPALFTVVNADSCERLHLLVPFDIERAQAWSDRAVMLIEATRAGQLLPRFTDDRTDWRCRMCPHAEKVLGSMIKTKTTKEEKLGKLLRLLSSEHDGEMLATVQTLRRALQGAGGDFHTLAETIDKSGAISEAAMRKLYDAGFEAGQRATESTGFHNMDTAPSWHKIACHCRDQRKARDEREQKFVEDMCRRTVHGGKLSEKQQSWLRKIYARR